MNQKRGQVALEFLMTYGWAIAIIMIFVAVLFSSGILNFNTLVQERCDFFSGLECIDFTAQNNEVFLFIQNRYPITLHDITVQIRDCGSSIATSPTTLAPGENQTFTVSCPSIQDEVLRSTILFNFTNSEASFSHSKTAQLVVRHRVN